MAGRTVTLKGNPQNVEGTALTVGSKAPDYKLQANDMSEVTLASSAGKARIICTVPSVDTAVCDKETRQFNTLASQIPNVEILTVSVDLPMAQKRWCAAAGIDKVKTVSDHRTTDFGRAYGVLVRGGPLDRFLARAVFVVDPKDTITHVEYVPEIAQEPDYESVLAAARRAAGA